MTVMSNPTPKSRRWFKWSWLTFSLRTMFVVVTVFAVWLGWELKYVRDRKAALDLLTQSGGTTVIYGTLSNPVSLPVPIPWWRRLLGDEGIPYLLFPATWTDEECNHAIQLFPEARPYPRPLGWKSGGKLMPMAPPTNP